MDISRKSCLAWGVYILLDVYANALRYDNVVEYTALATTFSDANERVAIGSKH